MTNSLSHSLKARVFNKIYYGKYLLFFLLFLVFNNAKIFYFFNFSFYGGFLAFLLFAKNPFCVCLTYLASCLVFPDTTLFIFNIAVCVVGIITSFVFKKIKKPIYNLVAFFVSFLVGIIYLFLLFASLKQLYICFVEVFANSAFCVCVLTTIKTLKARKLSLNMSIDESFCFGIVITLIFCGLQNLSVFSIDLVKLFGLIFVLIGSKVFPNYFGVIVGVVCGFGAGLCAGNFNYITYFSLVGILAFLFKDLKKFYLSVLLMVFDLCFNLFFYSFSSQIYLSLASTLVVIITIMLIPNQTITNLKLRLFAEKTNDIFLNIIDNSKNEVSKKLAYTSQVFYEMNKNFRSFAREKLDNKNAKIMLCNEIIKSNCSSCPQKNKCLKGFNSELKRVFENLSNIGFEKGKITLVDLPAYLTNRCIKANMIVKDFNSLLNNYKKYTNMVENLDSSKILIADQLDGISIVLDKLARDIKTTVKTDNKLEKEIKETLLYNNIIPIEVVCFDKDEDCCVASIVIRNIDFNKSLLENILYKVYKKKMALEDKTLKFSGNLIMLNYVTAPTYKISFGLAQSSKGGEDFCGDNHSELKLDNNKFLFAISDGMGHGEQANKTSELSLSLIENYYKAGFDNQIILTSVNSLLNLTKQDNFSAIDIGVVDLKSGEADFIKQGASLSFIKSPKGVSVVESSSLPIGILQKVKPKITRTVLTPDDMVIMMSDGVADAFVSQEILQEYLTQIPQKNPQEMAETILQKAKSIQKNYPKDDMTVLVGRLFYNCA